MLKLKRRIKSYVIKLLVITELKVVRIQALVKVGLKIKNHLMSDFRHFIFACAHWCALSAFQQI